ncbi:MAG: hypothetical protein ABI745_00510 [Caldimonas sp.]
MNEARTYPDATAHDAYWRENFRTRPYVGKDDRYDDFGPAYAYGVDSFNRHDGRKFDDVESDLSRDWEKFKGKSKLTWERAKGAVRDAWDRMTD